MIAWNSARIVNPVNHSRSPERDGNVSTYTCWRHVRHPKSVTNWGRPVSLYLSLKRLGDWKNTFHVHVVITFWLVFKTCRVFFNRYVFLWFWKRMENCKETWQTAKNTSNKRAQVVLSTLPKRDRDTCIRSVRHSKSVTNWRRPVRFHVVFTTFWLVLKTCW